MSSPDTSGHSASPATVEAEIESTKGQVSIRERMLVGGDTGSSKTFSFLTIVNGRPDHKHVVIEVDDGYTKVLPEFPDVKATIFDWIDQGWQPREGYTNGDQLSVYHCPSFKMVRLAQQQVEAMIAAGDLTPESWICVDGIDLIYNRMRYELIERTINERKRGRVETKEDPWEMAVAIRAAGAPLLEGGDWDMIHSFYETFLTYLAFQIRPNLYVTTNITTIDDKSPYESDDIKKFYESLGVKVKFEGQKRTPRVFDTLLAFKKTAAGWFVNIWKDRGGLDREYAKSGRHSVMSDYTNGNFFHDIGVKHLGWPA